MKKINLIPPKFNLLIQLIGSLLFLLLPILFSPDITRFPHLFAIPPFQRSFLGHIILLGLFFLHTYYLAPRYFFTQKYELYLLLTLLAFVGGGAIPHLLIPHSAMPHFPHPPGPHHLGRGAFHFFFPFGLQALVVLSLSFLWSNYQRMKALRQTQLETELRYLKSQIQPHFLFNTLNGIYAAAINEKANKTAALLIHLSQMMRYLVSETQQEQVSLEKELQYIDDYIQLQQMRLGDTLDLVYEVRHEGGLNLAIAPLLLMPFIENAFKYGVNPEQRGKIVVQITVKKAEISLYVENLIVTRTVRQFESMGLGVANTQSRLQLLYPDRHRLEIIEKNDSFVVNLSVRL